MAGSSAAPTGWVHSYESCAIGDGPGIRFAVFLQGCPLRCRFCHNPDTWKVRAGRETTVDEVMAEVLKYRSYMRTSGGGVTLTGGEPLLQPEFAAAILSRCKEAGLTTVIDTAGHASVDSPPVRAVIDATDIVLHDIKSIDPEQHRWLTGWPIEPVLDFARRLSELGKTMWIQHVLVPGVTLRDDLLEKLAAFVATLRTVEHVELLPFHKLGEYKWRELQLDYTLADTPPATAEDVARAAAIFSAHGVRTV